MIWQKICLLTNIKDRVGQGCSGRDTFRGITTNNSVSFRSQLNFSEPIVVVKSGGVNLHSSWIRIFSPSDY